MLTKLSDDATAGEVRQALAVRVLTQRAVEYDVAGFAMADAKLQTALAAVRAAFPELMQEGRLEVRDDDAEAPEFEPLFSAVEDYGRTYVALFGDPFAGVEPDADERAASEEAIAADVDVWTAHGAGAALDEVGTYDTEVAGGEEGAAKREVGAPVGAEGEEVAAPTEGEPVRAHVDVETTETPPAREPEAGIATEPAE
jgi:hypothetical protein